MVQHFHVHLDLLVDGRPVPVPANLGIDVQRQLYAELHTHAETGVVHAEAADPARRSRSGSSSSSGASGSTRTTSVGWQAGGGQHLWAYVDGRPLAGDPARLRLVDHQEIVLAYGSEPPSPVPSTFDFAANPT